MAKIGAILVIILILAVVGAGLYLAYGNFPVQSTQVEKVVPNARFTK